MMSGTAAPGIDLAPGGVPLPDPVSSPVEAPVALTGEGWPDGPCNAFADALREALVRRGLALDRVRAHLLATGNDLSIATLSYWQTGRSAPVRRSSIEAIGALEVILRVPRGTLARALHVTQGARRAATEPPAVLHVADDSGWLAELSGAEAADATIADLGLTWDGDVDRLIQHDVVVMGVDRRPEAHCTRDLIVARAAGVDRVVMARAAGEPGRLALVSGRIGCRLGRSRVLPAHRVTVAELLLDRPLLDGEPHVMEHGVRLVGGTRPMDWFTRAYLGHTAEGVVRIDFRADDLPDWVGLYVGPFTAEPRFEQVPVRAGTVAFARHDFPASQVSFRWTWRDH